MEPRGWSWGPPTQWAQGSSGSDHLLLPVSLTSHHPLFKQIQFPDAVLRMSKVHLFLKSLILWNELKRNCYVKSRNKYMLKKFPKEQETALNFFQFLSKLSEYHASQGQENPGSLHFVNASSSHFRVLTSSQQSLRILTFHNCAIVEVTVLILHMLGLKTDQSDQ